MTTQAQLRNRYVRETITTATPAQLVVMLYDRLIRDLTVAEQGLVGGDVAASHGALVHAQDIVNELASTLDTSVWKEGEALARIYEWVLDQLLQANMKKDPQFVRDSKRILEPIADAWRQVMSQGVTGEQ